MTDVFLVVENRLLREALIRIISRENDIRIVGASAYSPAIDQEIASAHPQIVLLDPNGFSLSRATVITALRAANENLRFVLVNLDLDESTFLQTVPAGVLVYVSKDASALEIVSTVRAVMTGLVAQQGSAPEAA